MWPEVIRNPVLPSKYQQIRANLGHLDQCPFCGICNSPVQQSYMPLVLQGIAQVSGFPNHLNSQASRLSTAI